RAPSRREGRDVDAVRHGVVEGVELLDAVDQIARAVRDALEAMRLIRDRAHEPQRGYAHVLHGPDRCGDVHRVLWLVHDDDDLRQAGRRGARAHDTRTSGISRAESWRSPRRYTNS